METLAVDNSKNKLTKETYQVEGMSCASCANSIESIIKAQDGVQSASVNFAANSLFVEYDKNKIIPKEMKKAAQSIGYDLVIEDESDSFSMRQKLEVKRAKLNAIASTGLSIPIVLIAMIWSDMPHAGIIMALLAAPVVGWFGRSFFVNAYKQLKHLKSNMDTLVAISTGAAYLFSIFNLIYPQFWTDKGLEAHVYFEASAVVIAFVQIGKLIESKAKSGASSAIKQLMSLQPKTVTKIVNEESFEIPLAAVETGDVILIKPGDKVPVDGEVISGISFVDESMITGEPMPKDKKSGDEVYSGTINQKGSLKIHARKVGEDTVLSQIISMVENALMSKAPVQKIVDKVAGIFVPTIIGASILTFTLWLIFGGIADIHLAFLSFITILVIACPCALGLATPVAMMVGIGKGAEHGILIKDSDALEIAEKVNAVVLDKTGTITEGRPQVISAEWHVRDEEVEKFERILLSIEAESEHPIAEAVVNELGSKNLNRIQLQNFESETGLGVKAQFEGKEYYVGSFNLMKNLGVESHLTDSNSHNDTATTVYFANGKKIIAVIKISDKIKPTSAKAIKILQKQNIDVHLLSGDNQSTTKAIAETVGITHYISDALPSAKADFIKKLQKSGKTVAMVGDGINDSHALAEADLSIAMGKGSDIAIDVSKITIISSDLMMIPKALKLSTLTLTTIKQNLFWAFIYNLIGIPVAAGLLYPFFGFLLNPMIAAAAMAFSSVSVVGNSIRMKAKKL